MKKLTGLTVVGCLLAVTMTASAGDLSFFGPTLRTQPIAYAVPPAPQAAGSAIALYPNVRYKHTHDIAPCAVTKIVKIKDPCAPKPCGCCAPPPRCVYVAICVPPCGCAKVHSHRHGSRVTYDYGKYKVKITSKRGVVTVSYDD